MPMTDGSSSTEVLTRITDILLQSKDELAVTYRVKSLGVFGSFVRGEQEETSDIDILVEFIDTPGLIDFIALENHLSEILGAKVDLVMKDSLKPTIGERILREVVAV
jgi:predicted nucleotidyltransferase